MLFYQEKDVARALSAKQVASELAKCEPLLASLKEASSPQLVDYSWRPVLIIVRDCAVAFPQPLGGFEFVHTTITPTLTLTLRRYIFISSEVIFLYSRERI